MARKTPRPGRTLGTFLIGLAIAFGLVALSGAWRPELGLDLQGGTRITLIAKDDPTTDNLQEARSIIDQRVNGSGVSEAEVVTQGSRIIVVEIPGESRRDLTETVERQAQLRFRVVACSDSAPSACAVGTAADPTSTGGTGTGVEAPTAIPSVDPTLDPNASSSPSQGSEVPSDQPPAEPSLAPSPSGSSNRAPATYAASQTSPSPTPTASPAPGADPSADPTAAADPSAAGPPPPAPPGAPPPPPPDAPIAAPVGGPNVADPLTWIDAPNQEAIDAFNAFTCPVDGSAVNVVDDPDRPLVTCETGEDTNGNPFISKYLLSAAMIEGSELDTASAAVPQGQINYVVQLDFNGEGTEQFTAISQALVNTTKQFGIVLDGQVISAPTMNGLITNGQPQIEGNFTQATAQSLATSLKYGALPIAFEDPSTETIGPSLAGDQLRAGLIAGAFGLGLVLIYCMLYYRGLGLVVVASLLVAGAWTYALVLLLSKTAGFTLTLPGIAGLIIAVGITADSFIIFFERIRDEMREGKSMKIAVETGWKRAKVTRLAAQVVSLLSAAVLYIFATGVVKGFGFALGLSTLVDLAILFWFTKPMMSWLARFKFFNTGHRMSGLSKSTLGMDGPSDHPPRPRTGVPAGGKA